MAGVKGFDHYAFFSCCLFVTPLACKGLNCGGSDGQRIDVIVWKAIIKGVVISWQQGQIYTAAIRERPYDRGREMRAGLKCKPLQGRKKANLSEGLLLSSFSFLFIKPITAYPTNRGGENLEARFPPHQNLKCPTLAHGDFHCISRRWPCCA